MRGTLHSLPVLSDAKEKALPADGKDSPYLPVWWYAGSIFLSAFLLFQVQPILAKLIVPWFGGAAAVWVISLAFYQVTYLLGNVYAYVLIQREPQRSALGLGRAAILLAEGLTVLLLVLLFQVVRLQSRQAQVTVRNFYGVLRVSIVPPGRVRPSVTHLRNGTVVHGEEFWIPLATMCPPPITDSSPAWASRCCSRGSTAIRVGVISGT